MYLQQQCCKYIVFVVTIFFIQKNIDPHMRHKKRNDNRHNDIIMVSKKNEVGVVAVVIIP